MPTSQFVDLGGPRVDVAGRYDNVTHPLNQNDDDGSSTDEYELDDFHDNTRSPATVVTASESTSCDICCNAPRDKVALLPCGHATFCQ